MTFEDFNTAFRAFQYSFNKDPDEERTRAYFESLRYYEPVEIAKALAESKTEDEFFPSVATLVSRIKSTRKPKVIACEYCSGNGFEFVYSSFEIVGDTHKCGPPVSRETYESDPITYRMFAKRCRCRPEPTN